MPELVNCYEPNVVNVTNTNFPSSNGHNNNSNPESYQSNGFNLSATSSTTNFSQQIAGGSGGSNVANPSPLISAVVQSGETALSIACRLGNIKMMEFLIDSGANIDEVYSNGKTILHLEAEGHKLGKDTFFNVDVMQLLIKNGANLTVKDDFGYFPLDYAVLSKLNIANSEEKFSFFFFFD